MPMEDGKCYWTAKISVAEDVAYYCVSETLLDLLRQILEKGQTHFPGLLEVKSINLETSREILAHTPVPSHIAERAYKKIPEKEIKEAKIPAFVSIPIDAELMPIVKLLDEEKGKGFIIASRKILAQYEILAIATAKTKQKIEDARIEEKNGKVFWVVFSDDKEMRFDLTTGELLKVMSR
jgi:uncharacterized membrane protein YkoI